MQLKVIAFCVGLGAAIQVNVVGAIAVSELICLGLLIFNLDFFLRNNRATSKVLVFGILWVFGILISDAVNFRPIEDTIKAVGAVILLLSNFLVVFAILSRNLRLLLTYGFGLGISYALQYYYFPTSVMQSLLEQGFASAQLNEIYFAISFFAVAIWATGSSWFLGYRKLSLVLLASYSLLALSYDRRSVFLVGLLAVFYLATLIFRRFRDARMERGGSTIRRAVRFIVVCLALLVAAQTYIYAASKGLLGESALRKYEMQASNEVFGLASGRLDFFQGIYGALQRPIFGYGSYAEDTSGIRWQFSEAFGLPAPVRDYRGLPGHSHIVGAWLFAGVLSLPFWLYIIRLLVKLIFKAGENHLIMAGYVIPTAINTLWHVMFSPFANRIELAVAIALSILYFFGSNERNAGKNNERQFSVYSENPNHDLEGL